MLNKLIFLIFVTLGLIVIVLCIIKSTKIEEHYIMNSEYSDVILPCEDNENKNSYKIKDVLIILKKYNVELEDIKIIRNKLLEKGSKKRVCQRALLLILDTYLIYYKPIIDTVISDLKKLNNNDEVADLEEKQDDNLEEKQEADLEEKQEDDLEEKQEEDLKSNNMYNIDDRLDYDEINKSTNVEMNCKNINNFVSELESDGFITKKNKNEIIGHYNSKCEN